MGPNRLNLAVSILKEPVLPIRLAKTTGFIVIVHDIGSPKNDIFTHSMTKLTSSFYI